MPPKPTIQVVYTQNIDEQSTNYYETIQESDSRIQLRPNSVSQYKKKVSDYSDFL
jgi:hypothetical protein